LATNGRLPIDKLSRRIVAAAFISLLATVALSIAFIAITRSASEGLLEAQIASGAPEAPLSQLADVLVWGQAGAIAALSLLTAALFGFAWYVRARMAPLEALGCLAVSPSAAEQRGLHDLKPLIERLVKDAARLEADLARLSSTATQARTALEDASVRAAKASHAALEAAGIAREGTQRMTIKAEESVAALLAAIANRTYVLKHTGASDAEERTDSDADAAFVLASLAGDLDALERFARDRNTIASESAAALTVVLVEAIDRLNNVAERISATADLGATSEAA
jgi:hypothetical protein